MNKLPITLATLFLAACVTDPVTGESVPDWTKIDVIGDEALAALDTQILLRPDEAGLRVAREQLKVVDDLVEVLVQGGTPGDISGTVDTAISIVDQLIKETDPSDTGTLTTLATVRSALGLVRVALA